MDRLEKRCWVIWFIVAFVIIFLTSCKTKERVITNDVIRTIDKTVTIRDTIIEIEKDSSYYSAYIECINNKPVLKPKDSKSGKNLKEPNVKLNNGLLEVECETRAQQLFIQWKEQYIKEYESQHTNDPVYIEISFRWYEKVLLVIGAITLTILIGYAGVSVYKILLRR